MQEDIRILEKFAKNTILYGGRLGLVDSQFEKIKQAIENLIKSYRELEKENTDLKELYIRIAKHFEKEGHIELSKHMLAQIEATRYFTTWEDYKTWVSKEKIREYIKELNSKIFNVDEIETVFIIKQIQILEELLKEE